MDKIINANNKIKNNFSNCVEIVSVGAGYLSIFIVIFFLFGTIADVFARTVINRPIAGIIEYCSVLLPPMVFLGLAMVQKNDGHINVTLVLSRLAERKRLYQEIINTIICVLFVSILGYETLIGAIHSYQINEFRYGVVGQDINIWWAKFGITFGCWILFLQYISDLLRKLFKLRAR